MKRQRVLPEEVYEQIKRNTPKDIDKEVLKALISQDGFIQRIDLINQVFKVNLPKSVNLANLRADRLVRLSLGRLKKTYPIVGSSGYGGYQLVKSAEMMYRIIAENRSREARLREINDEQEAVANRFFAGMVELPGFGAK